MYACNMPGIQTTLVFMYLCIMYIPNIYPKYDIIDLAVKNLGNSHHTSVVGGVYYIYDLYWPSFFWRYTRWHLFIFKVIRKVLGIDINIFSFMMSIGPANSSVRDHRKHLILSCLTQRTWSSSKFCKTRGGHKVMSKVARFTLMSFKFHFSFWSTKFRIYENIT